MLSKKIIFAFLGSILLLTAQGVIAVENPGNPENPTASEQTTPPTKNQKLENACKRIEENIARRIERFDANKERHLNAYRNMHQRLTTLVTKLKQKGFDTNKLETDLKTLDVKIKKMADDYTVYINKLKESQNYACGQSKGEFLKRLNEARKLLKTFREDILEVRKFFVNTIRPDLIELREQARKMFQTQTRTQEKTGSPTPTAPSQTTTSSPTLSE